MKISVTQAREMLDNCQNPLFLFDDDCDGLCSYLIMWKHKKEGKGYIVKGRPMVDEKYLGKVEENLPDRVFILDIAVVEQEFIDGAKRSGADVVWIDHHPIIDRNNVKHFNPHYENKEKPTSQLSYEITDRKEDEWLAVTGTVSDWYCNDFVKDYAKRFPDLISPKIKTPEAALYDTKIGLLARIFSFNMKGKVSEVMKAIKTLSRIFGPEEILEQQSEAAKFIYKRYENVNKKYQKIFTKAMECRTNDEILLYIYSDDEWSLTKDISNELVYRNPDKIIIIGREKSGDVKMSIRAKVHNVQQILEKSLAGIEGYGGGHEHACGANVKKHNFDRFMENFREELKK